MIKTIGVLGAGQMGNGIAHVFAQFGYQVVLYDIAEAQLEKAISTIRQNLERQAKKGAIPEQLVGETVGRIMTTKNMTDLANIEFAVEAVTEHEPLKLDIFRKLDDIVQPSAILASNTSSIPITKIASVTKRPDKVIGMHFMNPVPVMKLVEVIRGIATDEPTFQAVQNLAQKLGKITAVSEDFPAFIVNRILVPMINEAVYALYEGVGSVTAIDTSMKLGANHPMGPLELGDFIGLDTCLSIMQVLYEGLSDSKYRPCPLLVKYVEAGWLGRKSGRGFYDYTQSPPRPTR